MSNLVVRAHTEGLHRGQYRPECPTCRRLLALAKEDHSSHAGFPSPVEGGVEVRPGWWVISHDDAACLAAYQRNAQRMSES